MTHLQDLVCTGLNSVCLTCFYACGSAVLHGKVWADEDGVMNAHLLSTIRTLTPALFSALAHISPAGPAPMMRTSTLDSGMVDLRVETWFETRRRPELLRPSELKLRPRTPCERDQVSTQRLTSHE